MSTSSPSSIDRRRLLAAGAWSVPVIAVAAAAPAAVASPCDPTTKTVNWATMYRWDGVSGGGTSASGTLTIPASIAGASAVTATITARSHGRDVMDSDNLEAIPSGTYGGRPNGALRIHTKKYMGRSRNEGRQEITFAFNRPLTDLDVRIVDIDGAAEDRVDVTPGFVEQSRGRRILGSGQPTDPWRLSGDDDDISSSSTEAAVHIRYAGPIQTFTIYYWHNDDSDDQNIYLPGFTLTARGC